MATSREGSGGHTQKGSAVRTSRLLHEWQIRMLRPGAKPVTATPLQREVTLAGATHRSFMLEAGFTRRYRSTVTPTEAKNYLRGAEAFADASAAKGALAGEIRREGAYQRIRGPRSWPSELGQRRADVEAKMEACRAWRDIETRLDARAHRGECIDAKGRPADLSRCVLEHTRSRHVDGPRQWCRYARVSEEELSAALEGCTFDVNGRPPPDLDDQLLEQSITLEVMADLFKQLAEMEPTPEGKRPDGRRGRTQPTRDLLMAAQEEGVSQKQLMDAMLQLHPHAICELFHVPWNRRRGALGKHFREVRRTMRRKRPGRRFIGPRGADNSRKDRR